MYEIHDSWLPIFSKYSFSNLNTIYENNEVYPSRELVFRVFEMDVKEIRICLVGQDCYHGPNQAHGLSFSVPTNQKIPPSLRNIFKELKLEFPDRNYNFTSGSLEQWFYREKIFLLNSSLTVEKGKAGSHMNIWTKFTDDIIKFISENNPNCVFLLLGNYAKLKTPLIQNKDKIVSEVHPSPLAKGFIGSNVFQRVEKVLGKEVNWSNT
jgi:uracil-DNA glycosylase